MTLAFDMDIYADRPIIELNDIFKGCNALLDTGALFPLWTKSVELLYNLSILDSSGKLHVLCNRAE